MAWSSPTTTISTKTVRGGELATRSVLISFRSPQPQVKRSIVSCSHKQRYLRPSSFIAAAHTTKSVLVMSKGPTRRVVGTRQQSTTRKPSPIFTSGSSMKSHLARHSGRWETRSLSIGVSSVNKLAPLGGQPRRTARRSKHSMRGWWSAICVAYRHGSRRSALPIPRLPRRSSSLIASMFSDPPGRCASGWTITAKVERFSKNSCTERFVGTGSKFGMRRTKLMNRDTVGRLRLGPQSSRGGHSSSHQGYELPR